MQTPGRTFKFLAKAAVGVLLLTIFIAGLDRGALLGALASARLSYVALALAVYAAGKFLTALRWTLLARPLGFAAPLKDFVAYYFIGMFFNLAGLGTVGGDAGKVFYLAREKSAGGAGAAAALALVSILADRAVGLAALVWIAAAALVAFPEYGALVPAPARYATYALGALPILAYVFFPVAGKLLNEISHPLAAKLHELGSAYRRRPSALARALALSLVFHAMQIWVQVLLAGALDFELRWSYASVFFPMVDILTMLPVSVSGVGLREGGNLFFLKPLGVAPEKAVALGMLWLAILILSGLVGGAVFVLRRRASAAPTN